ncbi:MAG: aminotransferase class I/II-fold pyridoxal phosphate-dependent enzyme, partial [Anaerolineales bacterium]|nr:aminotransferase class I/II-fold pyridoxal phosphate-dependent enzyme [Anaerolineales bacterium]
TAVFAAQQAHTAGWTISFDLNFRRNLWSPEAARATCAPLLALADVLITPLRDAQTVLGIDAGLTAVEATAVLAEQLAAGLRPKFVYTIPDYQNPTGRQMSQPRRAALCALAEQYDFLIIEDAPYADLRYAGTAVPPIIALDPHGRTLHLGSFSKIFAPLRLGWMVGP